MLQLTVFSKTHVAFEALHELLNISVWLQEVFPEVFAVLEDLLAAWNKTLGDCSRQPCVAVHVKIIILESCDTLANATREQNRGVHSFLVLE
jgi:hypothetical protein